MDREFFSWQGAGAAEQDDDKGSMVFFFFPLPLAPKKSFRSLSFSLPRPLAHSPTPGCRLGRGDTGPTTTSKTEKWESGNKKDKRLEKEKGTMDVESVFFFSFFFSVARWHFCFKQRLGVSKEPDLFRAWFLLLFSSDVRGRLRGARHHARAHQGRLGARLEVRKREK